jgi:hypothetical protein
MSVRSLSVVQCPLDLLPPVLRSPRGRLRVPSLDPSDDSSFCLSDAISTTTSARTSLQVPVRTALVSHALDERLSSASVATSDCVSQTVSFLTGHADPQCTDCMQCGAHFTVLRRRHLCRACLRTICKACAGTPLAVFQPRHPTLRCAECVAANAPLFGDPSHAPLQRKAADFHRHGSTQSDDIQSLVRVVRSFVFTTSRWERLVATEANWSSPVAEARYWTFVDLLDLLSDCPHEYSTAMDRELRRLAEQPGNPLFGTMQAFAWEFQEAFRYWLDHQPRRTLKHVKAEMAAFMKCALPVLEAVLLPKDAIPEAFDVLHSIVLQQTQRRAHPVLRDVLRALHADKDRALAAGMEEEAAAVVASIPAADRPAYAKPTRLLAQLGLAADADSKTAAVMASQQAICEIHDAPVPGATPASTLTDADWTPNDSLIGGEVPDSSHLGGRPSPVDSLFPVESPPGHRDINKAGADFLVPGVIYCVLQCAVPCLWTELELLRLMHGEDQFYRGQLGYAMTTLEGALRWLSRSRTDCSMQDEPERTRDCDSEDSDVEIEALRESLF